MPLLVVMRFIIALRDARGANGDIATVTKGVYKVT